MRDFGRLGLLPRRRRAAGFDAASVALFAAMTVQPSASRKALYDALIRGIKADGVWGKLDWLGIGTVHDFQAGLPNIVAPSLVLTPVNDPSFVTDRGWTGNGVDSYFNTNWNPLTAVAPKFTQNNAHMGVWCRNDVSAFNQADIGHYARSHIAARSGTLVQSYPNANAASATLPVATSVGHSVWVKPNATTAEIYKNGAFLAAPAVTTAAPFSQPFLVCAANQNSGVPTGFSTRNLALFHWGAALTATEVAALNNRLSAFVTAVGA